MHPHSTSINIKHFPNIDFGNSNPNQNKILPEKRLNHKFPTYNIQFLLFCFYRTIHTHLSFHTYYGKKGKKCCTFHLVYYIYVCWILCFVHTYRWMRMALFTCRPWKAHALLALSFLTYKKYANLFRLKLMIHMKVK